MAGEDLSKGWKKKMIDTFGKIDEETSATETANVEPSDEMTELGLAKQAILNEIRSFNELEKAYTFMENSDELTEIGVAKHAILNEIRSLNESEKAGTFLFNADKMDIEDIEKAVLKRYSTYLDVADRLAKVQAAELVILRKDKGFRDAEKADPHTRSTFLAKLCRSTFQEENFQLKRQIRDILGEDIEIKWSLKGAAEKGDADVYKILVKEFIGAIKAINLYTSKTQIGSVLTSMYHQLDRFHESMKRMKRESTYQRSTEVMKSMRNRLIILQASKMMQEMAKEIIKAGMITGRRRIIDELEPEEYYKLLRRLTAGQLGTAPAAVSDLPEAEEEEAIPSTSKQGDDFADVQERLQALRSQ